MREQKSARGTLCALSTFVCNGGCGRLNRGHKVIGKLQDAMGKYDKEADVHHGRHRLLGFLERFTAYWDSPNDSAYCETCASVGLALFALRMARLTREAKYIDMCECALYNTVRAGIAMTGDRYFYVNPLEVWPASCMDSTSKAHVKAIRQKWFDVACCPTNVACTFASLGQYVYTVEGKNLYINLFVSNQADASINGHKVGVRIETNYQRTGNVKIAIDGGGADFALHIRVPAWMPGAQR